MVYKLEQQRGKKEHLPERRKQPAVTALDGRRKAASLKKKAAGGAPCAEDSELITGRCLKLVAGGNNNGGWNVSGGRKLVDGA